MPERRRKGKELACFLFFVPFRIIMTFNDPSTPPTSPDCWFLLQLVAGYIDGGDGVELRCCLWHELQLIASYFQHLQLA